VDECNPLGAGSGSNQQLPRVVFGLIISAEGGPSSEAGSYHSRLISPFQLNLSLQPLK